MSETPETPENNVTPTPEVPTTTSSDAVTETITVEPKKELVLKPFEIATLVLIAVALIWFGAGLKHDKKPVVKPVQKVVAVVKKETPKQNIIKVTPAQNVKKTNVGHRVYTETRDPGWKKWGPKK